MAEQRVHVDNPASNPVNVTGSITTSPSGTQNVAITSPSPLLVQPIASLSSAYAFSVANQAGVVAANNFVSIFNPVGSGKTIFVGGAFFSTVATAATTSANPMRGFRITTATGGSLQAVSTIAKFKTSQANPIAEVRINNPTVTLGAALFNVPPPITASGGSGGFTQDVEPPPNSPAITLVEGEGVVFRTEAGDVDQSWNITAVWSEA